MGGQRVFPMPDLGEGLEDGEIVAWLVAEGDTVSLNQPLVEIETAKATVEIPSPFTGAVVSLHGRAGESIAVGAPLVTFAVDTHETPVPPPEARPPEERVSDAGASAERVAATPPVRKLAKELRVDLRSVPGTGTDGRISADDVRAAAEGAGPEGADRAGDPTRATIAANLERQAAIPQVSVFRSVDCSALEALRADLGVSPLPIVVAALARVLSVHPRLNARWTDGAVEQRADVHVGLAVDTDRGLVVAVLRDVAARDVGARGIGDIAVQIKRLAEAARSGSLSPDEMRGATIAVSNTGTYGSEAGTPILSPGTSVTIAVGAIAPRALVVDGEVVARPACTLSCTFDHRVLDGATVGRALTELVSLLELPDALGDLPR